MPPLKKTPGQANAEALRKAGCDYARKQVAKIFLNSNVEDHTDVYPRFLTAELVMGKVLGEGGFGVVHEIRSFKIEHDKRRGTTKKGDHEVDDLEHQEREFLAEHCIRDGGDARYAVKFLKKEIIKDPAMFILAIKDMAIESRFLSSIKHPHIVKMRALSTGDPYSENFFIIMDRLYDTLETRIETWRKRYKAALSIVGRLTDKKGLKVLALLEERVVAAYDISSAFEYLHSHK